MKLLSILSICSITLLLLSIYSYVYSQGVGSSDVSIQALVEGCGDGVVGAGEDCDGSALSSATCMSKGFTSGTLSCTASCLINTSACVYTPPSSGGSSGGSSINAGATVVLVGKAYPLSVVTILKDSRVIAETIASPLANFQVSVTGLSAGRYTFMVYGTDAKKIKSSIISFPVTVSKGTITKIEDIYIAPTIGVDKSEVRRGDTVTIFGQTVPVSIVTLEVNSPQQFFAKTIVDTKGVYVHQFDTSVLEFGDHSTQSKSATNSEISAMSSKALFKVGTNNVLSEVQSVCPQKADLNGDCRVNLVDFSIVAFWYQRTLNISFLAREKEHLNGDGVVNLIDFSIMAFNWTG